MQKQSRVLHDEDCDEDEPLINIVQAAAAARQPGQLPRPLVVIASSSSSSDSSVGDDDDDELGKEQIMFFNPLFFEFQKNNWLTASTDAAKQFAARKLARGIKRKKCNESATQKRNKIQDPLPKINRRKPISHHAKTGPRSNRLARSEGEMSTEDEISGDSDVSTNTKNVCTCLETMWKNEVQDNDNVFEIWKDMTVEHEDFEASCLGASFEEFKQAQARNEDDHFVKYGAIIAANLSFSTSLQTGYTMITISTKRSRKTRIIGCSVSISSRSKPATAIVCAATTHQQFQDFTTASLENMQKRKNTMHSAKLRRGLTKKNNKCKCVFRLQMDKFFFWALTPTKWGGSCHSKHPPSYRIISCHMISYHIISYHIHITSERGRERSRKRDRAREGERC
jgi:hypothetical protein